MNTWSSALTVGLTLAVAACATVQYGDKRAEAKLKELLAVPGMTSLYVCREAAAFVGAGNRPTVFVNNKPIGTLKPNSFAHVVVEPGPHDIRIKRNPGGYSGVLTINSKADDVVILWVGMTGGGFGVLTVDYFTNRSEAEQCVKNADFVVEAN
jgi:hypothetical protein